MKADSQHIQLEKCAARYPAIMTAICEFQKQVYEICEKAVTDRLGEICRRFRIDRTEVKFERWGDTPEDFEEGFETCHFGVQLHLPDKGWAYAMLRWEWDGLNDPQLTVRVCISSDYVRKMDRLEVMLKKAHCRDVFRDDDWGLLLSAPLALAEVSHLENKLKVLIDRWVRYLTRVTHKKRKAAAGRA